jgi:tetratricopeptide (TPR) repeat protein
VVITICETLLAEEPDNPDWLLRLDSARAQEMGLFIKLAKEYEALEGWADAATIYADLMAQYPGKADWEDHLRRVEGQKQLNETYNQALALLESGNRKAAMSLLAEVIYKQPDYKQAPRFLLLATTGVDVVELQSQFESQQKSQLINPDDARSLRRAFMNFFHSDDPDAFMTCPDCGSTLKAKNLARHFIQKHRGG